MIKALLLSTVLVLGTITGTQNAQAQSRTDEVVIGALILGLGVAAIAESRRRHHHRHHYREHYRGHHFVPHHHHRHHLDHPHLYREHHHRHHYRHYR